MKKILTSILLSLSIIFLVSCGPNGGNLVPPGPVGNGPVSIYIYGQAHEKSIYQKIINKFSEETGIEVIADIVNADGYQTNLTASLGTKNAPDVFYANPSDIARYANNSAILDLKPYLEYAKDNDGFDYTDYLDGLLDYYMYDTETKTKGAGDAIWAVPKDVSSYPLAYNKNIINKAVANGRWVQYTKVGKWASNAKGMPLPWENDPDTNEQIVYTWEEFTNACKATKFDEDDTNYFGTALIDTWSMHSWIWSSGGNWLSEDGKTVTVNTPEFLAGFKEFIDLMDNRGVSQTREQMGIKPHYDRWMAGQVAFFNVGVWDVAAFEGVAKSILDYGLMPTPRQNYESDKWYSYIGTLGYSVSAKTSVPNEAVMLAQYMSMSEEAYNRMTKYQTIQLPTTKSNMAKYVADDTIAPVNKGLFLEIVLEGRGKLHPTAMAYDALWYDEFIAELSKVWKATDSATAGEMSPAEYVAYIQPKMQTQLDIALQDEKDGI